MQGDDDDTDHLFDAANALRLARAFVAPAAATAASASAAAAAADADLLSPEDAGCGLWDLSASPDAAAAVLAAPLILALLTDFLSLQLARCLADTADTGIPAGSDAAAACTPIPSPCRLAELCLGILANLYSHPDLSGAVEALQHGAVPTRGASGSAAAAEAPAGSAAVEEVSAAVVAAAEVAAAGEGAAAAGGDASEGDPGLPGLVVGNALFLSDAPLLTEACRLCTAALSLGQQVSVPWLPPLLYSDSLARLLWVADASAHPPLTERCMQLLTALLAAAYAQGAGDGSGGGGGECDTAGDGEATNQTNSCATAVPSSGAHQQPEEQKEQASPDLLQRLLDAGLLLVLERLLVSALQALQRLAHSAAAAATHQAGDPWHSEEAPGEHAGSPAQAAAAAAAEPVLSAVLGLLIELTGLPGGTHAIESHKQQSSPQTASEAAGGGGGGDSPADKSTAPERQTATAADGGTICALLPRLLVLLISCGHSSGSSGQLRGQLLMALTLLPAATAAAAEEPGVPFALAEALIESDPEDLDCLDAAWFLLAAAAERRRLRLRQQRGGPEAATEAAAAAADEGREGEEREWRRALEVVGRAPVPPSAARYAAAVMRVKADLGGGRGEAGGV